VGVETRLQGKAGDGHGTCVSFELARLSKADKVSATLMESHATGASVLLGDDSGRMTALGWEFERGQFGENTTVNGNVKVRKVDLGIVSNSKPKWIFR
jgi:hypothetical protein